MLSTLVLEFAFAVETDALDGNCGRIAVGLGISICDMLRLAEEILKSGSDMLLIPGAIEAVGSGSCG